MPNNTDIQPSDVMGLAAVRHLAVDKDIETKVWMVNADVLSMTGQKSVPQAIQQACSTLASLRFSAALQAKQPGCKGV